MAVSTWGEALASLMLAASGPALGQGIFTLRRSAALLQLGYPHVGFRLDINGDGTTDLPAFK